MIKTVMIKNKHIFFLSLSFDLLHSDLLHFTINFDYEKY